MCGVLRKPGGYVAQHDFSTFDKFYFDYNFLLASLRVFCQLLIRFLLIFTWLGQYPIVIQTFITCGCQMVLVC